jgi:predicted Rdx family selenoprotein
MADCIKSYMPLNETGVQEVDIKKVLLWDRKAEGGFPGTCARTKISIPTYISQRQRS